MRANTKRAWLVFAGLGALAYGCSGESRTDGQAGDAGATTSGGSSGASEGDAGDAALGGESGSAGRGGSETTGGSAGSGTGGAGGDVSGKGGNGASSSGGAAGADVGGSAGANAGGTAGASAGTAGSGGVPPDECDSDADCPPLECLVPPCPEPVCALGGQGYRVCRTRDPLPVGTCTEPTGEPCCATSDDCQDGPGGRCVPFSLGYCGGPAPPDYSTCRYDTCASDTDCTDGEHGVCLVDYPRSCSYGACNTSADCTQGAGGRCVMTRIGQPCPELVVFCTYDDDPCDSDGDCPPMNEMQQVCEADTDGHGRHCVPWQPPPP